MLEADVKCCVGEGGVTSGAAVKGNHISDALFCPSFPIFRSPRASNYHTTCLARSPLRLLLDPILCSASLPSTCCLVAFLSPLYVCTAHSAMRPPTRRPPPRHAHGLPFTPPTPLTFTGLASGLFPTSLPPTFPSPPLSLRGRRHRIPRSSLGRVSL